MDPALSPSPCAPAPPATVVSSKMLRVLAHRTVAGNSLPLPTAVIGGKTQRRPPPREGRAYGEENAVPLHNVCANYVHLLTRCEDCCGLQAGDGFSFVSRSSAEVNRRRVRVPLVHVPYQFKMCMSLQSAKSMVGGRGEGVQGESARFV